MTILPVIPALSSVIPTLSSVIPALSYVIPALSSVIPAEAGIQIPASAGMTPHFKSLINCSRVPGTAAIILLLLPTRNITGVLNIAYSRATRLFTPSLA